MRARAYSSSSPRTRRFAELRCYKACPPLVAAPQGAGRDSDNDEVYDQSRLLLSAQAASSKVDLEITEPEPGAAVSEIIREIIMFSMKIWLV